jgi:hypothetical protein
MISFQQQGELRWLQIGRGKPRLELYLRGWHWAWRDYGSVLTIAIPGLVLRWLRY